MLAFAPKHQEVDLVNVRKKIKKGEAGRHCLCLLVSNFVCSNKRDDDEDEAKLVCIYESRYSVLLFLLFFYFF